MIIIMAPNNMAENGYYDDYVLLERVYLGLALMNRKVPCTGIP